MKCSPAVCQLVVPPGQLCRTCMLTLAHSCPGCNSGCLKKRVNNPNLSQTRPQCRHFVEFLRETAFYDWEAVGSIDAQMNDRDNIQASRWWICMCLRRWIAFSQYEADTRRSRLFVFIWWQLTAVFPFNKIRLKKLVVHSLICHLTEGATWGRPYPIHSERLIRDSLIHRGPGSALTACTCTKQQMGGWLVSVPKKPPLSFPFIRGPQHICRQLLSHFLFSCLIKRGHKVTWTMASHHQHVCVCVFGCVRERQS